MPSSEPIRSLTAAWKSLPLRMKVVVWYVLPLPLVAIAAVPLSFSAVRDYRILILLAILIEMVVGLALVESLRRRLRELKVATERARDGQSFAELRSHSWELNNIGQNFQLLAAALRDQRQIAQECRSEMTRLFDEAPLAYLECDLGGTVTRVNRKALELLGRSSEEVCGTPLGDMLPFTAAQFDQDELPTKPDHRSAQVFEEQYARLDGTRWLSVHESPIRDAEDKTVALRFALIDMTIVARCQETLRTKDEELSKALTAAAAAGQARIQCLSNVSNDLRVQLNGITGFAELMFDGKVGAVSADQRECLGDILTSASNLEKLVDRLIEPAETVSTRRPAMPQELVDLKAMLHDAYYVVQVLSAGKRGISIDIEFDPMIRKVAADKLRLKHAITGLVSCAVRMAPSGGRLLMKCFREGADSFRLEISNRSGDGPVIASREVETELAQARQLVEEAGGQAGVRQHLGHQTILFATIPTHGGAVAAKVSERSAQKAEVPEPGEESRIAIEQVRRSLETLGVRPDTRRKVLIVGEHIGNDPGLIEALEQLGYTAFWLRDVKFTLQTAEQEQLSAVIVDLEGKGLSNYEFVEQSLRSVGMSTPVLAFPGHEAAAVPVQVRRPLSSWHGGHKRTA